MKITYSLYETILTLFYFIEIVYILVFKKKMAYTRPQVLTQLANAEIVRLDVVTQVQTRDPPLVCVFSSGYCHSIYLLKSK